MQVLGVEAVVSDAGTEISQVQAIDPLTGEITVDEEAPVIVLRGPSLVTIQLPSRQSMYSEQGIKA